MIQGDRVNTSFNLRAEFIQPDPANDPGGLILVDLTLGNIHLGRYLKKELRHIFRRIFQQNAEAHGLPGLAIRVDLEDSPLTLEYERKDNDGL